MTAALTVIGLVPWLLMTTAGVALMATGRHLPFGFPRGIRPGLRLRLSGLVYVVVGVSYVLLVVQAGVMHLDALVGTYLFLAAMLFYTVRQERAAAS